MNAIAASLSWLSGSPRPKRLVPMPTIDPEIVVHSAELLTEYGPDFKYGHYLGVKNALQAAGVVAGVGTIFGLAQIPPAKALEVAAGAPLD